MIQQSSKLDTCTQTLDASSPEKVSEKCDQTGMFDLTNGNTSMLKMMSELNQDIKEANREIKQSVASYIKIRSRIVQPGADSLTSDSCRQLINGELRSEVEDYLQDVTDQRIKTNSLALCSPLYQQFLSRMT